MFLARTSGWARFAYNHMPRQRSDAWNERREAAVEMAT
ncbi:helix-turn-helix domain-containing protein [Paraburkholderia phenazinium]|nr:helix-turn-helix domain-containing protein [Paraburkholderia phenazinium]